ncbi:unnamed protein product [Aspergillus oryzae]|uniref:Unnamed protein product n=1 Tax=Aspergillus oryzae TaxID=5062 RepID=A0AAN5BW43_ASPOZ|nr:unnamed protein product [Aspergillus oryzae]
MKWAANLLDGDTTAFGFPGRKYHIVPYSFTFHVDPFTDMCSKIEFVDVADLARVHVVGLLHPEVKSERLFAFASTFTWKEFVGILRKLRPGHTGIPSPPENELRDLSEIVPARRAKNLLQALFGGSGWVGLEESIRAGIASLGPCLPSMLAKDSERRRSTLIHSTMTSRRQYDLILLGATGYTGMLTTQYIFKSLPLDLKWAIAGRNRGKLEQLAQSLMPENSSRQPPGL